MTRSLPMEPCPNCGKPTVAFVSFDFAKGCPACAPTPDKKPHNYKPVSGCDPRAAYLMSRSMYEELRADISPEFLATGDAIRTHALAAMAIRNGVCCLDPGDCNGPCELV